MTTDKRADLCGGQRYIWLRHHQVPAHARHDAHIVTRFPLPARLSVAAVRTTLNYLVRRHEALRTTYHHDADADPWQRVHPPAAVPLVAASAERDGTPMPAEVIERLRTTAFDLATEWPLRACVVTTGGAPTQLVLVLNHMAFDAWSVDRFERELEALGAGVAARRPATLEPIRHQPLDLARHEASAEAVASRERAAAHWRAEIAALPADAFAGRRGADRSARGASLTSPAILGAVRAIADRAQLWPSLVHTAVHTGLLAAYAGADRVAHLAFNGNRGADAYTDVMTCTFTPLLMSVDCAGDPTFAELLGRVAERDALAREHAALPYDGLVALLARESARRGEVVRVGAEFNFLSHAAHASRARRTTFAWNPAPTDWAAFGSDTYLRVYELRDAVVVALNATGAVMGAEVLERFLRGYEAVLLALAEPGADLRLREIAALAGFPAAEPVVVATEPAAADPALAAALSAAVGRANGLAGVDPAACYVEAGGRVLRIPRVLDLLAEQGIDGLTVHDLAAGRPLGAIAAQLRTTSAAR